MRTAGIFFVFALLVLVAFALRSSPGPNYEIVETPEARELGLSGRDEIPHDYAMLFVFPSPDRHGIWMKDMKTSIDIVWVDASKKIIGIEREVSPDTYPHVFHPVSPVAYVIETRAGETEVLGWEVGKQLTLPR